MVCARGGRRRSDDQRLVIGRWRLGGGDLKAVIAVHTQDINPGGGELDVGHQFAGDAVQVVRGRASAWS